MFNFFKKSKVIRKVKIRIIAIAKDEAAYLPLWIHHHLSFGFNDIEIYVNNTTDNTIQILDEIIKKYPVTYILADYMFDRLGRKSFQSFAYDVAYKKALKESVTHILFLDIDEFWTPMDLKSTIHNCLDELKDPDVISFEWVCKRNEEKPFSFQYEYQNLVSKNRHVKSLFKTSLAINNVGIHNINPKSNKHIHSILANGKKVPCAALVDEKELINKNIKNYFILHRMWRSPLEYISLLGQGVRQAGMQEDTKEGFNYKSNRRGYLIPGEKIIQEINFCRDVVNCEKDKYTLFVRNCEIEDLIKDAQLSVLKRFYSTLDNIRKDIDNDALVQRVTKNIIFSDAEADADAFILALK